MRRREAEGVWLESPPFHPFSPFTAPRSQRRGVHAASTHVSLVNVSSQVRPVHRASHGSPVSQPPGRSQYGPLVTVKSSTSAARWDGSSAARPTATTTASTRAVMFAAATAVGPRRWGDDGGRGAVAGICSPTRTRTSTAAMCCRGAMCIWGRRYPAGTSHHNRAGASRAAGQHPRAQRVAAAGAVRTARQGFNPGTCAQGDGAFQSPFAGNASWPRAGTPTPRAAATANRTPTRTPAPRGAKALPRNGSPHRCAPLFREGRLLEIECL